MQAKGIRCLMKKFCATYDKNCCSSFSKILKLVFHQHISIYSPHFIVLWVVMQKIFMFVVLSFLLRFCQEFYQFFRDFVERHSIFDAAQYSGVFAWDIKKLSRPTKYVRQLAKDSVTLYLTQAPWEKEISWYQPELFTKVDFNSHGENWVQHLSNDEQDIMRKILKKIEKLKN